MDDVDRKLISDGIVRLAENATFSQCQFDDGITACEKTIKSHSIQNSFILDQLEEHGHVAMLKSHGPGKLLFDTKVSRNDASVFKGICNKHDSKLFHEVDFGPQKIFDKNNFRQLSLLALRAMFKEFFLKKNVIQVTERFIDIVQRKDNEAIVKMFPFASKFKGHFPFDEVSTELLEYSLIGQYQAHIDIEKIHSELLSDIENSTSDKIVHTVFEFDSAINWASCGISSPNYLMNGKHIFINTSLPADNLIDSQYRIAKRKNQKMSEVAKRLREKSYNYELMIVNLFPVQNKSYAIFSHRKNDRWMDMLVSEIKGVRNGLRTQMISKFIISNLENVVFRPMVISGLNPELKARIEKEFGLKTFAEFELHDNAIVTDLFVEV